MTLALVLGGGGSAGIGWETGVLHGLAEEGVDVSRADTVIGTSAGAIVGTRLRSGVALAEQYAAACEPVTTRALDLDFAGLQRRWADATAGAPSATEARRRIAELALSATTAAPDERRAEIAAMLPTHSWPAGDFRAVAVNGVSGVHVVLTRDSGVDLVDAVAASCAVPGVWPPVVLRGEAHLDGAVRSPTNADLAAGFDRVLVIAPMLPPAGLGRELQRLPSATRHAMIAADPGAARAFGPNPLDPRCGPAAAREGLRQGRGAAPRVAALLRGGAPGR